MNALIIDILATAVRVPDSGTSGLLLGLGILSVGVVARFLIKRKR